MTFNLFIDIYIYLAKALPSLAIRNLSGTVACYFYFENIF